MVNGFLSNWLSTSSPNLDEFLPVPFDYQPESEDECVIYSVWMVLHYFKNKHPNKTLRQETKALSPDEIMEDMTIVEGGWKPDQDELTLISERVRTLHFSVDYHQDGAPKPLFETIVENIDEGYPVIPFVNGPRLREDHHLNRDNDEVHSVVAAGYGANGTNDVVALHDPWGYPEDIVGRQKLEDAWDPLFNQVITVKLSNRGAKIAGGNQ